MGPRAVVSLEMSLVAASPSQSSVTLDLPVIDSPIATQSPIDRIERSSMPTGMRSDLPELSSAGLTFHKEQPTVSVSLRRPPVRKPSPTVAPPPKNQVWRVRPRQSLVTANSPVGNPAPLQKFAGTEASKPVKFIHNPPPVYPASAIARQIEGVVRLELHVNQAGEVDAVRVLRSSGHVMLDRAAVEAVRQWKGKPAKQWGRAIESIEVLPIRFRL